MLGTLVLLAFFGALGAVAVIAFVLFGPVPVNRKVTIVSRIQPVMPGAARSIQLEAPVAVAPPPVFVAPPPTPRAPRRDPSPIVPMNLRRPRANTPSPPPRQRMARGTEGPRRDFSTVEVTAPEAPSFEVDEMTHLDDAKLH